MKYHSQVQKEVVFNLVLPIFVENFLLKLSLIENEFLNGYFYKKKLNRVGNGRLAIKISKFSLKAQKKTGTLL